MDKKLLTPGPLTTSKKTKEAMLHDWGSRDTNFIELNRSIRKSLIKLIDGENLFECVSMQGSGTSKYVRVTIDLGSGETWNNSAHVKVRFMKTMF